MQATERGLGTLIQRQARTQHKSHLVASVTDFLMNDL